MSDAGSGMRKATFLARHAARRGFQATAQRLNGAWVVVARLPDNEASKALAGVQDG